MPCYAMSRYLFVYACVWVCVRALLVAYQRQLARKKLQCWQESEELLGLHITMGGFPMKAWLKLGLHVEHVCLKNTW